MLASPAADQLANTSSADGTSKLPQEVRTMYQVPNGKLSQGDGCKA